MNHSTTQKHARNGLAIDTLAMSQRLRAVGVPEEQANEQVEIIAGVFEHNMSTKRDIETLRKETQTIRADLKKDIINVRKEIEKMRVEMYQMKSHIIVWVAGMLLAQAGLIGVMQKLF